MHFYFERKIEFGAVSVSDSALFESESTSSCNKVHPVSQLLLHFIQILYFKNVCICRIIDFGGRSVAFFLFSFLLHSITVAAN